jgi:hypothetical protein
VKRNIEAVKGQIRRRRFIIAIDETHEPFYGRLRNLWIHDYRNGVKGATGSYKYIIVSMVSGDLRFILLVIPIPKISKETDYYVKELLIFVKSLIPEIRFALFVFECLRYNVWQFFKGRVPFRRFINILFNRRIIKTAVFAVIALLKEKGILDDKGPPQDMIYEELIGKFGYINGISLQHGC